MADQGSAIGSAMRDYRKGNWTLSETMVLIEAKRMDDERRMKRSSHSSGEGRSKPAELRWKWVEDYCWRKGCLRSQNQCNDKWDNLMRDYKRVREYERRVAERSSGEVSSTSDHEGLLSYWKLEKNERKEKNLPSNVLPQIYEALVDVVEKRGGGSHHHHGMLMMSTTTTGGGSCSNPNISYVVERSISAGATLPPIVQQQVVSAPISVALPLPPPPLPLPPPPPGAQPPPPALPSSQPLPRMCDSSDCDTSDYSDSPAKRRRNSGGGRGGGGGEGTSGGATASASTSNEVGTAICKSASIIAEALHASEEGEERRHKELMSLHERRLRIEESKAENSRQGINGLVDAINNLANSILALASRKNQPSAPK